MMQTQKQVDDANVFKELIGKLTDEKITKVSEKNSALDRIFQIWRNEELRGELLNEVYNRRNLIVQIGYCVRLECSNNIKKMTTTTKSFKKNLLLVWFDLVKCHFENMEIEVGIEAFFDTAFYVLKHNYDIWIDFEKSIWWKTLDTVSRVIEQFSLVSIEYKKIQDFMDIVIAYLDKSTQSNEKRDQHLIAKILLAMIKDLRLFQFAIDLPTTIENFGFLFMNNFEWDQRNVPTRSVLLECAYYLFVEFSYSHRNHLLKSLLPLFNTVYSTLITSQQMFGYTDNLPTEDDPPCLNANLIRFVEIYVSCAFPFCFVDVLKLDDAVVSAIKNCIKLVKEATDRRYSKAISNHIKDPDQVIFPSRLRFVARAILLHHNLEIKAREDDISPEFTAKRMKTETQLEAMLNLKMQYFQVVIEEAFNQFEDALPSEFRSQFIKAMLKLELNNIRKVGSMKVHIRTLSTVLRYDCPDLTIEELKVLFNKAMNWLYLPDCLDPTSLLFENMLHWLPSRFGNEINGLFDSLLKNLCRLTRLTSKAVDLLLYIIRNYDFDECYTFRDDVNSTAKTWHFRRQLIKHLMYETELDVDFSDVLLSLLFVYPNSVELEEKISFQRDEIGMVEDNLKWIVGAESIKQKTPPQKPLIFSTAPIRELVSYVVKQTNEVFDSDILDESKSRQMFTCVTLFKIKAERLNARKPLFEMGEINELVLTTHKGLLLVANDSTEEDLLVLKLGCCWEFSTPESHEAISNVCAKMPGLWNFVAFWDVTNTPDHCLREAIRTPRYLDSQFVGHCFYKIASEKGLLEKISLLRTFGKYLNQREYNLVAENIKVDLQNEIEQYENDEDRILFLKRMYARELVLSANFDFVDPFENVKLTDLSYDMLLLHASVHQEDDAESNEWFNNNIQTCVKEFPEHTAYYVQRVLKQVSNYKNLKTMLTSLEIIDDRIYFYMPNYIEFKGFVKFLDDFQRGCFDGVAENSWDELVDRKSYPMIMYALRKQLRMIFENISSDWVLHLAAALSTIANVVMNLSVQERPKSLLDLLFFDLAAVARCVCAKLFECKPDDDDVLSELILSWISALDLCVKYLDADWLGFMFLDLLYDQRREYPQLLEAIDSNSTPFVNKYASFEKDLKHPECHKMFNAAYGDFQKGTLSCETHPIVKTKIFWNWLSARIGNEVIKKKCIAQVKLLWIICPWLRVQLARQILCFFSEETLRVKQYKIFQFFTKDYDVSNIKLLSKLLLFDSPLQNNEVTAALYNAIFQFVSNSVYPTIHSNQNYTLRAGDHFNTFMVECFFQNSICFDELKAFSGIATHNHIYGVFALLMAWERIEGDASQDKSDESKVIVKAVKELIVSFDEADELKDYEKLLLLAICEVFTMCKKINPSYALVRSLIKANLLEEAFFYLKYIADFSKNPERTTFHLTHRDSSFTRTLTDSREVEDAYAQIVIELKDEVLAFGLPLAKQYESPVRAFVAENRRDWSVAAALYEESNKEFDATNALFYMGNNTFDLNNKDNYRRVIDLSKWPAPEPTEISHPKCVDNHNAMLYSLFRLACRGQSNYDLSEIWKNQLEKKIVDAKMVYPKLLNECRDLKLLESLQTMRRSQRKIKLPEDADYGIASSFLLGGWTAPDSDSTKRAFDTFFEQIQEITLTFVRDLRDKKSFQRALNLVKIIEDVAKVDVQNASTSYLEHAKLHFANNELNAMKFLLTQMIRKYDEDDESSSSREAFERASNQISALLMAAELSDQEQKTETYFSKAMDLAKSIEVADPEQAYECALKYAKFASRRYREIKDHTKSNHFRLQNDALEKWPEEIEEIRVKEEKTRRLRELAAETADVSRINQEHNKFLLLAMKNFFKALSLNQEDESIIPNVAAMLIQNTESEELMELVTEYLDTIPSKVWIPVQEILISYLFDQKKPISSLVSTVVSRLLTDHPYHSIYPIFFQTATTENQNKVLHEKRRKIATALINNCRKHNSALGAVTKNLVKAHDVLLSFGATPIDSADFVYIGNNQYKMKPSSFEICNKANLMKQLPIPTCDQPLNNPKDYSTTSMITFAEVLTQQVFKLGGLSAPKLLQVRGSDGKIYKLIFKPEDLRPDSLVQLLFRVSNIIINSSKFQKRSLRPLRRYNTVPINRELGIIECCANTVSLNDLLVGPARSGGMHKQYGESDLSPAMAHKRLAGVRRSTTSKALYDEFMDICKHFRPVFRLYFYQHFAEPHVYHKHIQLYEDSLALWSIVCYVVGLGDRHLNNILIDQASAELVHIDLGMIFDFSKRALPIPERIPFRLTRDIVDPILFEGLNSRFKHVAIHALEQFRQNAQVIIGISSLLLHDPISVFGNDVRSGERNILAETAISRMTSKLEGKDLSLVIQTSEQQVSQLINEARDATNLSLTFVGWMPFC